MMSEVYKIIKTFIVFIAVLRYCSGAKVGVCSTCLESNNAACLNETHFSICLKGEITPTITPCPENYVCTDNRQICQKTADGFTPICYEENCNNCESTDGVFTCLDQTTYGFCYDQPTPDNGAIRTCPDGFVCNTYAPEVCVSTASHQPSCLAMTTPKPPISSSTASPRDANAVCAEIGKTGYFKSDDTTCREYIYCYILSGQYLGWYYYCDGYFNSETMKCQMERPADCEEQQHL